MCVTLLGRGPASTRTFTLDGCGSESTPSQSFGSSRTQIDESLSGADELLCARVELYGEPQSVTSIGMLSISAATSISPKRTSCSSVSAMWMIPSISPASSAALPMVADSSRAIQTLQFESVGAGVYTHVFTPATINVLHVGFNHLHTTRFGPVGNTEWDSGRVRNSGHSAVS